MNATEGVANLLPGAILHPGVNLHLGANCAYKRGLTFMRKRDKMQAMQDKPRILSLFPNSFKRFSKT